LGDILIFRAMRRKRMPALSFLIVSVGLYIIFQNIISLFFWRRLKIYIRRKSICWASNIWWVRYNYSNHYHMSIFCDFYYCQSHLSFH
jgi:hypothetical protein